MKPKDKIDANSILVTIINILFHSRDKLKKILIIKEHFEKINKKMQIFSHILRLIIIIFYNF